MFKVHSRLSKKILQKFLSIYTIIFMVLSVLILAGASLFFLHRMGENITSQISVITNVWDEFETAKREQIYMLLSENNLAKYIQEYYRSPSAKNRERINLCLANFQTSDSGIQYLLMEDDEGNLFHSLNSYSGEIQNVLRTGKEYRKTRENGVGYISAVKAAIAQRRPILTFRPSAQAKRREYIRTHTL